MTTLLFQTPESWANYVTANLIPEDREELRSAYWQQFQEWRAGGFSNVDILNRLGDAALARKGQEQTYITTAELPVLQNKLKGDLWLIPFGACIGTGMMMLFNYSDDLPIPPRLALVPLVGLLIAVLLATLKRRIHPVTWIYVSNDSPWTSLLILAAVWLRRPEWSGKSTLMGLTIALFIPITLMALSYALRDRGEEKKLTRLIDLRLKT